MLVAYEEISSAGPAVLDQIRPYLYSGDHRMNEFAGFILRYLVAGKRPDALRFIKDNLDRRPNGPPATQLLAALKGSNLSKSPEFLPAISHYLADKSGSYHEIDRIDNSVYDLHYRNCDLAALIIMNGIAHNDFGSDNESPVTPKTIARIRAWIASHE